MVFGQTEDVAVGQSGAVAGVGKAEQHLVLGMKLRRPAPRGPLLERRELMERLDDALRRRVSLVSAPAGFGKTWLVADWLGFHSDVAQVWLTLDVRDNDPVRLWRHLVEGVGREIPELELGAELVRDNPGGVDLAVDAVVAGLEGCGEEVVVVLDDAHLIEDAVAVRSLERLIAEIPVSTHVVLVARHDPAMRLARMRAAGDLAELRSSSLQLTADEASRMVAIVLDQPVSQTAVNRLLEQTAGWVAGFRMALSTAAQSEHPEEDLERSSWRRSEVSDFLVTEVLDGLEPNVRDFLLDTSPVERLHAELCNAITGRSDGAAILERLASAGLFTFVTDEQGGWFVYHEVFRELLNVQLRKVHPERVSGLHHRAASWLHDHGYRTEAIDHAIAAGQPSLAADWLVETSRDLEHSGQTQTLVALADAIDKALTEPSLRVLGILGHALFLHGRNTVAPLDGVVGRILEVSAERDVDGGAEGWVWPGFPMPFDGREDFIAIFACALARRAGDPETVLRFQNLVPTKFGVLDFAVAEALIWLNRNREAEPLLERYTDWAPFHGAARVAPVKALGLSAVIALSEGRLAAADRQATVALDLNADLPGGPTVHAAYSCFVKAWCAWERGELNHADSSLGDVLALGDRLDEVAPYVLGRTLECRIRRSQGRIEEAVAALDRGLVLPSGRAVTGHFAALIRFERARLALLDGDLAAAEIVVPDWRERLARGAPTTREHAALARFLIMADEDPPLPDWLPEGAGVTVLDRIRFGLLRAHGAIAAGDEAGALDALAAALEVAARTGHRQRFLDERGSFGSLLDNAAARAGASLTAGGDGSQGSIDAAFVPPVLDLRAVPASPNLTPIDLVEPLTDRELDVLRLLPSHLSSRGIAEELHVTVNTVKFHVKAIYRKLDTRSRADAVERARSCGLVQ